MKKTASIILQEANLVGVGLRHHNPTMTVTSTDKITLLPISREGKANGIVYGSHDSQGNAFYCKPIEVYITEEKASIKVDFTADELVTYTEFFKERYPDKKYPFFDGIQFFKGEEVYGVYGNVIGYTDIHAIEENSMVGFYPEPTDVPSKEITIDFSLDIPEALRRTKPVHELLVDSLVNTGMSIS